MAETASLENRRILLIDDNPAIHADFRKILCADDGDGADEEDFEAMEAAIFGQVPSSGLNAAVHFELDGAFQGAEGFAKVQKAVADGRPYALAFVDVRMPPGWDGVETLEHLFEVDSALQTVICSAYSDFPWDKLHERLRYTDRYLILKKPFEAIEVRQMAMALTRKWQREAALGAATRWFAARHAVIKSLSRASILADAAPHLLQAMGEVFDKAFGALWEVEGAGSGLRCLSTWSTPGAELDALCSATASTRGEGWPSILLTHGRPTMSADLAGSSDSRAALAMARGLRTVLGCVVFRGGSPVAILELWVCDPESSHANQPDMLAEIATSIGDFLDRASTEAALRASENKNRALLDALPDAVLRIDAEGGILERRAATEIISVLANTDNLMSLVAKRDAEPFRQVLSDAIDKSMPRSFELRIPDQGEERIYEMRIAGSGRSEAVVILHDTTEASRAAADEAGRRERELKLYAQMDALAALSVPLIPVAEHVLVMPLVGELDTRRGQRMRETLLEAVAARSARTAILDVTGVPRFDQGATEEIVRAARAVRLIGARFVLTGLGPETARQLVALGLDLGGIKTSRTLQAEIEHALIRG